MSSTTATRYAYIDALRGLAVLMVVITHCHNNFVSGQYWPWLDKILDYLTYGVPLFYIISSYTLCHSSFHRSSEPNYLKNFFIRRFFRIVPMFYFALILYLVLLQTSDRFWLYTGQKIDIFSIISSFLLLHGLHPSWVNSVVPGQWSIATEVSFYLIFPFLFSKLTTFRKTLLFLLPAFIISQIFYLSFEFHPLFSTPELWRTSLYYNLIFQLPVFLSGFLIFYLERSDYKISFDKKIIYVLFSFSLLFLLDVIYPKIVPDITYFTLFFSFLIIFLQKFPYQIIVNKFMVHLGKISFSVYLLHLLVLTLLHKIHFDTFSSNLELNLIIRLFVVLSISIGISTLSYHLIEQPFQKLGQRLIRHQ